ncbi:Mpo1-like protein [Bradyrhizobium sp. Pa8]|uniref:Mpo1-like protein n=1 Tax=Bradyrhizobium sp. Pa8 TaxID=3386552 RepID=UPI00403FAD3C
MNSYFWRLLADYVEYHRTPWNCAMHVFGILFLFLATLLPLRLWFITVFGIKTCVAAIALVPVLIFWFVLDFALGAVILGAAIALFGAAAMILNHVTPTGMWSLTAILMVTGVALLIMGHLVFERRRPAMIDNPTHLLVGPLFVAAKLVVVLGFRHDLAMIIGKRRQASSR